MMTIKEWVRQGEAKLSEGPHPDRARLDAETLLVHLMGKNKAWLMAHLSDDFGGCQAIGYAGLIERRLAGEPIQYITGEQDFYGIPFRVTPAVLIPRPETELLVEQVILWANGNASRQDAPLRIVDVGTGSGAIAVALARELPEAAITAIDLSEPALSIARDNALRNGVDRRIRFLCGDLLAPVAGETFDMVVSNPPYVAEADRDRLTVEVREHEPAVALFAGSEGVDIYQRLIPAALDVLALGGLLALEIGYGQDEAVTELLARAGFQPVEITPDLQGIPRVALAWRV
jgi:release factor glutamine methyltransferase